MEGYIFINEKVLHNFHLHERSKFYYNKKYLINNFERNEYVIIT